jgi:hypothetical protein
MRINFFEKAGAVESEATMAWKFTGIVPCGTIHPKQIFKLDDFLGMG